MAAKSLQEDVGLCTHGLVLFSIKSMEIQLKIIMKKKKKDDTYAFITQSPLMHNNKTTHTKDRNRAKTVVIHLKLTIRPENYGNIVFIQK